MAEANRFQFWGFVCKLEAVINGSPYFPKSSETASRFQSVMAQCKRKTLKILHQNCQQVLTKTKDGSFFNHFWADPAVFCLNLNELIHWPLVNGKTWVTWMWEEGQSPERKSTAAGSKSFPRNLKTKVRRILVSEKSQKSKSYKFKGPVRSQFKASCGSSTCNILCSTQYSSQ